MNAVIRRWEYMIYSSVFHHLCRNGGPVAISCKLIQGSARPTPWNKARTCCSSIFAALPSRLWSSEWVQHSFSIPTLESKNLLVSYRSELPEKEECWENADIFKIGEEAGCLEEQYALCFLEIVQSKSLRWSLVKRKSLIKWCYISTCRLSGF